MPNQKAKIRWLNVLVVAMCLLGFFLRLGLYIDNRSFWIDESMLALNVVDRSFIGLLKPLNYNQGAPLGFLLLLKAALSLWGNWDYVLRLVPLVTGLGSIPVMYYVAKKYDTGWAPYIAMGLFVFSTRHIYFSSELKQYSSDVLVALIVLLVAEKCFQDSSEGRALVVFGVVASLAIWFSHPALFVIMGVFLALGLSWIKLHNSRWLLRIIGMGGVFSGSLLLLYLISLRHLAANTYLRDFWRDSFAPLPPWSAPGWYSRAFMDILAYPAGLPANAITVGLLLLGIFTLGVKRWRLMVILVAPFMITLVASAFRKYPFTGRLVLFLIPFLLLLLAEGIEQVKGVLLKLNRPVAFLATISLVVYFLYDPAMTAYKNLQFPPRGEDIKPVMAYVQRNRLNTDVIYVYYSADPAFKYYAPFYGFDDDDYIVGIKSREDPDQYLDDIDRFKGNERVWIVLSHNCTWCIVDEFRFIITHLDRVGLRRSEFVAEGAAAYLYTLP